MLNNGLHHVALMC